MTMRPPFLSAIAAALLLSCGSAEAESFSWEAFGYRTYWGDLHTHTNLSLDARLLGAGDVEDSIRFALTESKLDFLAITDHDIAGVTRPAWERQQEVIESYNGNGIIVFPGFEYTDPNDGHLNVFFRNADEATMIRAGLRRDPTNLWSWLDRNHADAITVPHHTALDESFLLPNYDWSSFSNAKYQRVVEIYSQHGSSESSADGEIVDPFGEAGSVFAAYELWRETGNDALKLGVVGSTDDHQARPGGTWEDEANIEFGPFKTAGGLVAVMAAPDADRDTLFDAIYDKRTYATTGARIDLGFAATMDSQRELMGGSLLAEDGDSITFNAIASGDTAPIGRIDLIQDGVVVASSSLKGTDGAVVLSETIDLDLAATGPRSWFMVKAYQEETLGYTNYNEDGELRLMEERAWSSPIFIDFATTSDLLGGGRGIQGVSIPEPASLALLGAACAFAFLPASRRESRQR